MTKIPFDNSQAKKYNLNEVNRAIQKDAVEYICYREKRYEERVALAAAEIAARCFGSAIVMLAGPSGSGKTTTANMLSRQLQKMGVEAGIISLDNFYLTAGRAPVLPDGRKDYESVHALDLELVHACFMELIEEGRTEIPKFSFKNKRRSDKTIHVDLRKNDVVIVEGIHAINPLIVDALPQNKIFKLFVSVESGIFENMEQVIDSRQVRLIRRMTRDYLWRDSSPSNTFSMWDGVVAGEKKNLSPFMHRSDAHINTLHSYEIGLYRDRLIPLLMEIPPSHVYYGKAVDLAARLQRFCPVPEKLVPASSLLREFIGGGIYKY